MGNETRTGSPAEAPSSVPRSNNAGAQRSTPPRLRSDDDGGVDLNRWYPSRGDAVPLAIACLMLACLWIDMPVQRAMWDQDRVDRFLAGFTDVAETFGHGYGVALILVSLWCAAPRLRWAIPRITVLVVGCGLLANLVKSTFIARHRPSSVLAHVNQNLWPSDMSVWDTFGGFFPLAFDAQHMQSFPSAHSATAWGLAFGLAWLIPRARYWFFVLAVLACAQRVLHFCHFPSDVVAGALLAWFAARLGLGPSPLSRWWDRREALWRQGHWRPFWKRFPEPAQQAPWTEETNLQAPADTAGQPIPRPHHLGRVSS
jgi:membrane-associated phospholipid phosphatase